MASKIITWKLVFIGVLAFIAHSGHAGGLFRILSEGSSKSKKSVVSNEIVQQQSKPTPGDPFHNVMKKLLQLNEKKSREMSELVGSSVITEYLEDLELFLMTTPGDVESYDFDNLDPFIWENHYITMIFIAQSLEENKEISDHFHLKESTFLWKSPFFWKKRKVIHSKNVRLLENIFNTLSKWVDEARNSKKLKGKISKGESWGDLYHRALCILNDTPDKFYGVAFIYLYYDIVSIGWIEGFETNLILTFVVDLIEKHFGLFIFSKATDPESNIKNYQKHFMSQVRKIEEMMKNSTIVNIDEATYELSFFYYKVFDSASYFTDEWTKKLQYLSHVFHTKFPENKLAENKKVHSRIISMAQKIFTRTFGKIARNGGGKGKRRFGINLLPCGSGR